MKKITFFLIPLFFISAHAGKNYKQGHQFTGARQPRKIDQRNLLQKSEIHNSKNNKPVKPLELPQDPFIVFLAMLMHAQP